MVGYREGYEYGERTRLDGKEAVLPDAVKNADYFAGYCDGYMLRECTAPKPSEILANLKKLNYEGSN